MVLYHVRDVEERCMAACEMVGGTDGEGSVLDWHLETTEWDHFAAVCEMEVIEGCLTEFGGCRSMADGGNGSCWEKILSWGGIGDAWFGGS